MSPLHPPFTSAQIAAFRAAIDKPPLPDKFRPCGGTADTHLHASLDDASSPTICGEPVTDPNADDSYTVMCKSCSATLTGTFHVPTTSIPGGGS